jgi:predicted metal-dependent hydrolase
MSLVTSIRANYTDIVSHKSIRIVEMVESFQGKELEAHYLGYFDCFNRQRFYEAHEVLEHLWLKDRQGADGDFYKGLIQLAGAFVHLQKNRLRPSAALFKLALANFDRYPAEHKRLNLDAVREMAQNWLTDLEQNGFNRNPLTEANLPHLTLEPVIR